MSLRTCESAQKMKFIKLMNFIKRAIKFLKRDNLDIQKINDVLEIDRQNERSSSDESDSNSANDSSANSPRFDTHFLYTTSRRLSFYKSCRSKKEWAPEKKSHMELTDPVLEHEDAVSHTDSMYEEDVLRFALRAAAEARARLTAKYPKRPRIGYLEFKENKTFYQTINDGSGIENIKHEVKPLDLPPSDQNDIDPSRYDIIVCIDCIN